MNGADTRQTIPYPVAVLILIAAVASGTASRVAFSGSFVDILMSGVLGSLLAIMQFAIVGRHQLLSNIFEIGVAGVLSFLAVSHPFPTSKCVLYCTDQIAWPREYWLFLLSVDSVRCYRPDLTWVAYLSRRLGTGIQEHSRWRHVSDSPPCSLSNIPS